MTKSTAITVAMLPDLLGVPERQPFLFCTKCGAEYSAHAGDYWNRRPDYIFRCCRRNMVLVERVTMIVDYQP